ncbi:MAG: hypothetical protein ACJ8BW_07190 [Ktedonobacteraceae bacterium]
MYTIDISTIISSVQSLWGLAMGALRLDPAVFRVLLNSHNGSWLALLVLFLGGVSEALGQSVALLVNRVSRRRFFVGLLITGIIIAVGFLVWVSTIWLSATFIFGVREPIIRVLLEVSLAYAPYLFGFLILLPYMGSFIDHVLDTWSFLAVLVAMNVTLGLRLWQALLCTLFGWLIFQLLKYTIGKPITTLVNRLFRMSIGVPISVRVRILTEDRPEPPNGART